VSPPPRKANLHSLSDAGIGEGVPLQPLPHTQEENRNCSRPLSDGEANQDLVPKQANEAEEGAESGEGDQRAGAEEEHEQQFGRAWKQRGPFVRQRALAVSPERAGTPGRNVESFIVSSSPSRVCGHGRAHATASTSASHAASEPAASSTTAAATASPLPAAPPRSPNAEAMKGRQSSVRKPRKVTHVLRQTIYVKPSELQIRKKRTQTNEKAKRPHDELLRRERSDADSAQYARIDSRARRWRRQKNIGALLCTTPLNYELVHMHAHKGAFHFTFRRASLCLQ